MYTWTVSARLNGAYFAGNIVSPAANASIKVDEIFSDFFKIYMEGAYFLNNPIYDGNGNHSFINQINANAKFTYMPDNKWDINIFPDFTFAQNFMHPAITMEAKYYAENFLVGAFAAYGYQSYIFPVQNSSIVINNPLGGIYFTWYLGKSLDLNFTGKYNMNIFNTSGAFTEGLTGIGLSWYPDKKFSLGGDILSGIDSAGYFMAGINMNIFYKFLRDFSLYADCSYKYYTSQAMMGSTATMNTSTTSSPQRGKPGAGGNTPMRKSMYSSNAAFQEVFISAGIKYTLDFKENDKSGKEQSNQKENLNP